VVAFKHFHQNDKGTQRTSFLWTGSLALMKLILYCLHNYFLGIGFTQCFIKNTVGYRMRTMAIYDSWTASKERFMLFCYIEGGSDSLF
jgi:hypothetical protein